DFQAHDAIQFLAAGGEHEDRHCRMTAQGAAQGEAVHLGQHDVQEHEVWLLTTRQLKTLRTSVGMQRCKAFLVQTKEQGLGNALVSLDQQDLGWLRRHMHMDPLPGVRGLTSSAQVLYRKDAILYRLVRSVL